MSRIWVVTIFPELIREILSYGVIGKYFNSAEQELVILNPCDYSDKGFKGLDSAPYGGGPGMVMRADVLSRCLRDGVLANYESFNDVHIIYTSPRGKNWSDRRAKKLLKLSSQKDLVFICGRYEGVDERFLRKYVNSEISIGDYVLSGGELAVSVILDSTFRFKENVLGNVNSAIFDSFENGLLDSPKYTKPREFEGDLVPEVLLSGDHKKIEDFNHRQMIDETKKHRPDLYQDFEEKQ